MVLQDEIFPESAFVQDQRAWRLTTPSNFQRQLPLCRSLHLSALCGASSQVFALAGILYVSFDIKFPHLGSSVHRKAGQFAAWGLSWQMCFLLMQIGQGNCIEQGSADFLFCRHRGATAVWAGSYSAVPGIEGYSRSGHDRKPVACRCLQHS